MVREALIYSMTARAMMIIKNGALFSMPLPAYSRLLSLSPPNPGPHLIGDSIGIFTFLF
jgi:hypothetical protein